LIAERELHVWFARTDIAEKTIRELTPILDDDERERVARFRYEDDQRRAIVARASLRILLGRYLDHAPHELRFVFGPQGKPALTDGALEFNVSHSGALVALAFARNAPLGVDVECADRASDLLAIAERFFSPAEAAVVRKAPDVAAAFYRTWTAKESVIKAIGGGLSIDLKSFRVTPARERFTPVESTTLGDWHVQALPEPESGYHAAVAIRGADWTTTVHELVNG